MITNGSLVPFAKQAKTTVKLERSWPVDKIEIVFEPDC